MPNEETKRGYPLPHPENIAVEDVVRIRTAIEKIDEDMSKGEMNTIASRVILSDLALKLF